MFKLLLIARLVASVLGASENDLVCWENLPTEPAVRYVCQVEAHGAGAYIFTNGGADQVGIATYAVQPSLPIEASAEAQAFYLYIEAVIEDGDTHNDWVTHLPLDRQGLAVSVGDAVAESFGQGTISGAELALYMVQVLKTNDPNIDPWVNTLPTAQRLSAQMVGEFLQSLDFRG